MSYHRLTRTQVSQGFVPGGEWEGVPLPAGFTLVGYGRQTPAGMAAPAELVVDAYAMTLPDGRVVTFGTDAHGDGVTRTWESWRDAASWYGAYAVWSGCVVTDPVDGVEETARTAPTEWLTDPLPVRS